MPKAAFVRTAIYRHPLEEPDAAPCSADNIRRAA